MPGSIQMRSNDGDRSCVAALLRRHSKQEWALAAIWSRGGSLMCWGLVMCPFQVASRSGCPRRAAGGMSAKPDKVCCKGTEEIRFEINVMVLPCACVGEAPMLCAFALHLVKRINEVYQFLEVMFAFIFSA